MRHWPETHVIALVEAGHIDLFVCPESAGPYLVCRCHGGLLRNFCFLRRVIGASRRIEYPCLGLAHALRLQRGVGCDPIVTFERVWPSKRLRLDPFRVILLPLQLHLSLDDRLGDGLDLFEANRAIVGL